MKKIAFMLIFSITVLLSTVVGASTTIQTYLFNVNLIINGENVNLPNKYKILNYNGYTYLPSRFIVESMKGAITYDERKKEIKINYLSPTKPLYSDYRGIHPDLKVGNLAVNSVANKNYLSGAHAIYGAKDEHTVGYTLILYDKEGKEVDRIGIGDTLKPGEVKTFNKQISTNNYSSIKMELGIFDEVVGSKNY